MFKSRNYSLKDVYHSFYKGYKLVYTFDFVNELPSINFLETTKKLEVPVTFIHGRKDVHVYSQLVADYYKIVDVKQGKQFIWMEKSAHIFHPEDAWRIEKVLINELRHRERL